VASVPGHTGCSGLQRTPNSPGQLASQRSTSAVSNQQHYHTTAQRWRHAGCSSTTTPLTARSLCATPDGAGFNLPPTDGCLAWGSLQSMPIGNIQMSNRTTHLGLGTAAARQVYCQMQAHSTPAVWVGPARRERRGVYAARRGPGVDTAAASCYQVQAPPRPAAAGGDRGRVQRSPLVSLLCCWVLAGLP
jgi:hypothetical protein